MEVSLFLFDLWSMAEKYVLETEWWPLMARDGGRGISLCVREGLRLSVHLGNRSAELNGRDTSWKKPRISEGFE